ncbi:MAG: hypothetical protein AAGK33_09295 [Pseudomonadota bacterium]
MVSDKDQKTGKTPLEVEATWAPSWEPEPKDEMKPDPKNLGERLLKYCHEKFEGIEFRKEAAKRPWRVRFRYLPGAMVQAAPTAFLLLVLFYMGLGVAALLNGRDVYGMEPWTNLRLGVAWMVVFCIHLGWKIASYHPHRLKPTLGKILRAASKNWIFILVFAVFVLADDAVSAGSWAAFGTELVTFVLVVMIVFGVSDLKLYEDELPKSDKGA